MFESIFKNKFKLISHSMLLFPRHESSKVSARSSNFQFFWHGGGFSRVAHWIYIYIYIYIYILYIVGYFCNFFVLCCPKSAPPSRKRCKRYLKCPKSAPPSRKRRTRNQKCIELSVTTSDFGDTFNVCRRYDKKDRKCLVRVRAAL